ncbi:MAG: hypothetical protein M3Y46_04660 [Actinomycetota bacterium]|nr:hypothetical protein [Actinomycetota bacterium]
MTADELHRASRPPLFDRIVFAALIPSMVLPAIAGIAAIVGGLRDGVEDGITGLVIVTFLFVTLGSMVLNAWLLLRHPLALRHRAFRRRISVSLVVLWALLLVWAALLFPRVGDLHLLFAAAIVVVSVVVFGFAVAWRITPVDRTPLADAPLGSRARGLWWMFVVVAAIAIVVSTATAILGQEWYVPVGTISLLLLGLPWSPLFYVALTALSLVDGTGFGAEWGVGSTLVQGLLALPVLVNVGFALIVLLRPAQRLRLTNWFFRLRA